MTESWLLLLLILQLCSVILLLKHTSLSRKKDQQLKKTFTSLVENQISESIKPTIASLSLELKTATQNSIKSYEQFLKSNQKELSTQAESFSSNFSQDLKSQTNDILAKNQLQFEQQLAGYLSQTEQELHEYREMKRSQIDAQTELVIKQVLQQKVWKSLKGADQHQLATAALDEVLSQGDISL